MKALAMRMAWDLKAAKHFKVCLKCGHMNNGEIEVWRRICRCAVPILVTQQDMVEEFRGMSIVDIRSLDEFRHLFGGEERTIVDEDEVDRRSRYKAY